VLTAEISARALDRGGQLMIAIVIDVSAGLQRLRRGGM